MQPALRRAFGVARLTRHHQALPFRASRSGSPPTLLDRWGARTLLDVASGVPLRLVLWDGSTWERTAAPEFTLRIASRHALWRLLRDPDLGFGEGYTDGSIEIDGNVHRLVDAVASALQRTRLPWHRLARRVTHRVGAGLDAARRNARHHYDLGNDFYRLWLDENLVYTCAWFPTPAASLEAAQQQKMERVCRKVHLTPGLRVVEAGCGWGALACYMAREHQTTVRAWNVSHEQVVEARRRAAAQDLEGRVTFIEDDWRRIDEPCDVFVSVGMLEHVGPARYAELGAVIDRVLDRGHGRGLLHFIGRDHEAPGSRWTRRYIFPGNYLPTLREVVGRVLEPYGFSVLDVENLRRHYTLTLEHWRDRFERAAPEVTRQLGERFTRMWRYYLAGAHAGFAAGYLQLFQVTFAREGWDSAPWTRPV